MAKIDESEVPAPAAAAAKAYYDQVMYMQADMDVRNARQKVQDLTHRLQDAQNMLGAAEKPYRDEMDKVAEYLKGHALEAEAGFSVHGVEVKYRKGYTRTSWDNKILSKMCEDSPSLEGQIGSARKEAFVQPSVTVGEA